MCPCILEMWSEAIKVLKGEYAVRAIKEHKMDQAIIFCRTKIDCDNMEQYFIQQGGGRKTCSQPDFTSQASPDGSFKEGTAHFIQTHVKEK